MIATVRCIKASDFLLVACSVAVILLATWPETSPRQWVQIRQPDGSLRQYSMPEHDPRIAQLTLALEKWGKAGQETRLAVAQWRAELADFYISRIADAPSSVAPKTPVRPVAFRRPPESKEDGGELPELGQPADDPQLGRLDYWRDFKQLASDSIADVEEIRRSRRALEIPPPIVFGPIQPGHKPWQAIAFAPLAGLIVASFFALWSHRFPAIQLRSARMNETLPDEDAAESYPEEIRLDVPAAWVRVHQPLSVVARTIAMGTLVLMAIVSLVW
jgi:hypothetical protein